MNVSIVEKCLLEDNNLNHSHLFSVLSEINKKKLDYADVYLQSICYETWTIEEKIIKDASYNFDQGVGIRAILGEKTGFAYSNEITLNNLINSAILARKIVQENKKSYLHPLNLVSAKKKYLSDNPINNFSNEEKVELLHKVDNFARKYDKRVKNVTAQLFSKYEQVLVAATDGTLAVDIRPLIRFYINVQVEKDNKVEFACSGGGGRFNYDSLLTPVKGISYIEKWTLEAVRVALLNLEAISAPAGTMQVVLGSGWPGILLHEAVGHGLEGDFNRNGSSVFNDKIGEKVSSELCTVVDDGTIYGSRGSLSIDDEGVPGKYNILIENGILKKYMQDKLSARLMGLKPTGNGRRESYAHLPMPRMTNTYMLSGKSHPEEIIESVKKGIFAKSFRGGQVDITSGNFAFSTSEAYLIEDGRITLPIKGATLIGSGIEIMQEISMVGNDLELDPGVGTCVKEGQNIPVSVGQPTLKINKIVVGGTSY